ncbi:MAG TPA: hypothetical protein VH880_05990 [Anaeromyxobacteraceae bacterium]|jgi:hypothetical protein
MRTPVLPLLALSATLAAPLAAGAQSPQGVQYVLLAGAAGRWKADLPAGFTYEETSLGGILDLRFSALDYLRRETGGRGRLRIGDLLGFAVGTGKTRPRAQQSTSWAPWAFSLGMVGAYALARGTEIHGALGYRYEVDPFGGGDFYTAGGVKCPFVEGGARLLGLLWATASLCPSIQGVNLRLGGEAYLGLRVERFKTKDAPDWGQRALAGFGLQY